MDLRQFASWCQHRQLALFDVARRDLEGFARHLEELGKARATISRRLCTITSLYRLLDRSPAVNVRRPRLDDESNATGLDRNEFGAMLVAAGLAGARDHALLSLLALNGLRVSEAIGADIDRLGLERGHRTLLVKWTEANAGLRVYSVDADRNELRTSRPHRIRGALRVKENEGWAGFAKHSVRQWRRRHRWYWK